MIFDHLKSGFIVIFQSETESYSDEKLTEDFLEWIWEWYDRAIVELF